MIIALVTLSNRDPEVHSIFNTLPYFQSIVGGYLEAVRLDGRTSLYCNEDAVRLKLPVNCALADRVIRGNFFLVGYDGTGEECSLTPEQVKTWSERILAGRAI